MPALPLSFRLTAALLAFILSTANLSQAAPGDCNAEPSQPQKAYFYPDEAQLEVEETLSPIILPSGEAGFLVPVPARIQRDSFLISVDGVPAQGYYWLEEKDRDAALFACRNVPRPSGAMLPENELSPARRALLEKIPPLAREAALAEGTLAAVESRLALWAKTLEEFGVGEKSSYSPADEAAKLDAAYAESYPALHAAAQEQRRVLEDVRRRLGQAEQDLRDFDNTSGVSVIAVPTPQAGNAPKKLRYAYVMPASCRIAYRLDARPDAG